MLRVWPESRIILQINIDSVHEGRGGWGLTVSELAAVFQFHDCEPRSTGEMTRHTNQRRRRHVLTSLPERRVARPIRVCVLYVEDACDHRVPWDAFVLDVKQHVSSTVCQ